MSELFTAIKDITLEHQMILTVVDILIVSYLTYRMILLIRGTRTMQMLFGFSILMGLLFISQKAGLSTLHWITSNFFSSIVLVIIILFQSDIRAALSQVGYGGWFGSGPHPKLPRLIETLSETAVRLSSKRTGALIVIERKIGLRNYISLGTNLDADPSVELLSAIFERQSPIHDGAVIIQDGRLATAGCFLPLSTESNLDRRYGTRHRAALGISEESDAVVLVVSEETGSISVVHDGELQPNQDESSLKDELFKLLGGPARKPKKKSESEPSTDAPSEAQA